MDDRIGAIISILALTIALGGRSSVEANRYQSCIKLERGGIWDDKSFNPSLRPMLYYYERCKTGRCTFQWLPPSDIKSITFKLLGQDDMRDYTFQIHFCHPIYFLESTCDGNPDEIAFGLRARGDNLKLERVHCRCPNIAEPHSYSYSYAGDSPSDRLLNPSYIEMQCFPHKMCPDDGFCYEETPSTTGRLHGGKVLCECPKKFYCPLYLIGDHREPLYDDFGRVAKYNVRCKKRLY